MFIDARSIPDGSRVEADLCIIGGGAAGITIAREFIGRDVSVVLLEGGDREFDPDIQDLYAGRSAGEPYFDLDVTRLRFFGGTTNHWGGQCAPLEAHEMASRPWVPGSGWPIGHEELAQYLPRAAAVCEIGGLPFDIATVERLLGRKRLPISGGRVRHVVSYVSPPTRFGERYGPELERAANVRVLFRGNATELRTNADATAVTEVAVRCLEGTGFTVAAKRFVLACGGIENARLLLLSNAVARNGLGNGHDQVGRYFSDHPAPTTGIWMLSRPDIDLSVFPVSPLGEGTPEAQSMVWLDLAPEVQEEHRLTSFKIFPRPLRGWYGWHVPGYQSLAYVGEELSAWRMPENLGEHLLTILEDIDVLAERTYDKVRGIFSDVDEMPAAALIASIEPMPNPESRVLLGDELDALGQRRVELRLQYAEADAHMLVKGTELLAAQLAAEGLGRVRLIFDPEQDRQEMGGRHHHMCTTRMHADPKHGVVDADCRVHGVANLFVAGSSVFTTAGAGTPTINIVALALRLADHIRSLP